MCEKPPCLEPSPGGIPQRRKFWNPRESTRSLGDTIEFMEREKLYPILEV